MQTQHSNNEKQTANKWTKQILGGLAGGYFEMDVDYGVAKNKKKKLKKTTKSL